MKRMGSTASFLGILVILVTALAGPASMVSAGVIEQLTHTRTGYFGYYPAMDDAGTVIYVNTSTNPNSITLAVQGSESVRCPSSSPHRSGTAMSDTSMKMPKKNMKIAIEVRLNQNHLG